MSSDLLSQIDKVLEDDIVSRHSFFQLQHFVVNKEPTLQSRMWQCVRELRTRKDAIEKLQFEIEETNDNLLLLDIEAKKLEQRMSGIADGEFFKMETEIKKRQLLRRKEATKKALAALERRLQEQGEEAQFFLKSLEALQQKEPIKAYDDPVSQREYWNERLTQELNMRLLLRQPIEVELAKTIFALHDEAPIKKQLINIVRFLKVDGPKAEVKLEGTKELENPKE